MVSRTQPSGPLCPLWQCFIHLSTLIQYQVVTSDKKSGVSKAGKLFLSEFVQGIGGARTHWTLKSFLQQFPEICSRALLRNSVNLETNQKPHSPLFSLLRNCFHRFLHHFHPFFSHLHLFDKIFLKIVPDFIYTDPETGPIWNQAFLLLTNSLRGNTDLTWPMYNVHRPMYSVWEEFVIRTSRDKMNAALLASHVPVCADDKTLLGWHSWENYEGITSVWYHSRS